MHLIRELSIQQITNKESNGRLIEDSTMKQVSKNTINGSNSEVAGGCPHTFPPRRFTQVLIL
jgi:hypothetical protein